MFVGSLKKLVDGCLLMLSNRQGLQDVEDKCFEVMSLKAQHTERLYAHCILYKMEKTIINRS